MFFGVDDKTVNYVYFVWSHTYTHTQTKRVSVSLCSKLHKRTHTVAKILAHKDTFDYVDLKCICGCGCGQWEMIITLHRKLVC